MENMEIWDALKKPPQSALKMIQGGRLKGKTDISPQWRYRAMTEQFGACGVGWKYFIEKLWLETANDEVCAFAEIGLSIKVDGEWSAFIPGIGGSMLVAKESGGLHVSDEAYKMAITDALSVAMKMIGVAADVYEGFLDGGKFTGKTEVNRKPQPEPPESKTRGSAVETRATVPTGGVTKPETDKPTTLQELLTWVAGHGKTYSPSWVCRQLNVKAPIEIENIPVAYQMLKEIAGW